MLAQDGSPGVEWENYSSPAGTAPLSTDTLFPPMYGKPRLTAGFTLDSPLVLEERMVKLIAVALLGLALSIPVLAQDKTSADAAISSGPVTPCTSMAEMR